MRSNPGGWHIAILLAMTNGHPLSEHPAQAFPGWLDLLATLMPDTVEIKVSGYLVFVFAALAAVWIWRRYPKSGRQRRNE